MPSQRCRLNAADLFGSIPDHIAALCDDLCALYDDRDAFAALLADANKNLTKHETGIVKGFLFAVVGDGP